MTEALNPSILAVDDTPANLNLLVSILKEQGYRVRPVPSGDFALRAVAIDLPDLVLLDISMPAMDGFEVCRRLKAEPATAEIPVIFLTAHTDVSEKVKAFGVGGVDYITKPFQTEEIRARVATHLENARQKKELRESYRRLGELETMRNSLVHMLVHDLRSPLTSISGLLELMSMEADKLPEDTRADLVDCRSGVQKMIGMVTAVLDVSKMEAGEMPVNPGACDAVRVTQQVVQEMRGMASQHNVTVTAATDAITLTADASLLGRVLQNLLANAIRFSPANSTVDVALESDDAFLNVAITDSGPGVPEQFREKIFSKYGAIDRGAGGHSTGLGLAFCRMAVEAHGGSIGVANAPSGKGSVFWFRIPMESVSHGRQQAAVPGM